MTSQNLNLLTPSNLTTEWKSYELIGSSRRDVSRCTVDRKTHESHLEFQKYCTKSKKSCYANFPFKKKSSPLCFANIPANQLPPGEPRRVSLCAAVGRNPRVSEEPESAQRDARSRDLERCGPKIPPLTRPRKQLA